nr:MAG TPA: sulfur globule protein [Caudoviricetes sp.]
MEAIERDIERFLAVGYGYGSGYGYGDGDGDGYGDGYGDGDGSGSGDGDGSGYGSGYGDGYGVKEFNGRKVYDIDSVSTLIYAVRGNVAKGAVLCRDLTLKDCWIAKRGNFFAHGDTLHEAVEAVEAKWRENRPLDERIAEFVKTHPALDEEYGDLFEWHHILTGSCEFGRRQWCEEHCYKPTDSITLRTFLTETSQDYGGDVIRQVAKEYGLEL